MVLAAHAGMTLAESDNASLDAAEAGGWHVVSMKNDWQRIFSIEESRQSE